MTKNLLYVVPNLKKVSGGPLTRISSFKKKFLEKGDSVIEGKNKLSKSIGVGKVNLTYIESATNRISLVDFISLLLVRIYSRKIVVFIRDIYVELFPNEFTTFRKKITLLVNRVSYFFLVLIANKIVFPTLEMGNVFYEKNTWFPKKDYFSLPPGTKERKYEKQLPDFTKKIGVLYLGGISYSQSGFEHFLNFADTFKERYNYYMLSGDPLAKSAIAGRSYIHLSKVSHDQIEAFVHEQNIGFAFHTRPRNEYDDITFPIKILDFITFRIPFISAKHVPMVSLLGEDYPLFCDVTRVHSVDEKIKMFMENSLYIEIVKHLDIVSSQNTYEKRYQKLFGEGS